MNGFYIKDKFIEGKVILAPMAGITSFSYRKFNRQFFNGLSYTEMISDCGLIYNNKRTFEMLKSDGSDRPLAVQLFGGSKETITKAIKILEESGFKYDILDLNLACPVPKVTKNNGGSSWLKDLASLKEMVEAVVKVSSKPVSAKIRLGYDKNNVIEIAKVLESAGISFLVIHCRTKKELYSGEAHYEAIANLHDFIKIPYGVSGNIFTLEDALKAKKVSNADVIAIARGGIGNPLLFKNVANYFKLEDQGKVSEFKEVKIMIDEQINYLTNYANLLKEEVGENRAVSILRGIAPKFFQSFSNCKKLKNEIATTIDSFNKLFEIIDNYKDYLK